MGIAIGTTVHGHGQRSLVLSYCILYVVSSQIRDCVVSEMFEYCTVLCIRTVYGTIVTHCFRTRPRKVTGPVRRSRELGTRRSDDGICRWGETVSASRHHSSQPAPRTTQLRLRTPGLLGQECLDRGRRRHSPQPHQIDQSESPWNLETGSGLVSGMRHKQGEPATWMPVARRRVTAHARAQPAQG